jgi:N-carbamoylputrescine amidase
MNTTFRLASLTSLLILGCSSLPSGVTLDPKGVGAQPKEDSSPAQAVSKAAGPRSLRIAIVQMQSISHDIDGNLKRATTFAETAASRGAKLVLFPEFMPTGAYLAADTWDSAEPGNGKTVKWLKSTSGRLHVWLGAGFFEADGEDFYDTFVLTTPEGKEAGRVRKQVPAESEAYFFRGYAGSHLIDTEIGKIGVGICAENYYCAFASRMLSQSADLILMPHAAPDMSESGGLPSPPGTRIASWYAGKLGVPVAMVNKVGRSYKPPPNEIKGFFPGLSAIVDSDGTVRQSMDDKEGIGIADVTMDPSRKSGSSSVCTGVGIAELAVGGAAGVAEVAKSQASGQKSYETNPFRKAKALAISHGRTNTPTNAK